MTFGEITLSLSRAAPEWRILSLSLIRVATPSKYLFVFRIFCMGQWLLSEISAICDKIPCPFVWAVVCQNTFLSTLKDWDIAEEKENFNLQIHMHSMHISKLVTKCIQCRFKTVTQFPVSSRSCVRTSLSWPRQEPAQLEMLISNWMESGVQH